MLRKWIGTPLRSMNTTKSSNGLHKFHSVRSPCDPLKLWIPQTRKCTTEAPKSSEFIIEQHVFEEKAPNVVGTENDIQITFLGTGSQKPSRERNCTAIHFRHNCRNYLFDCAEATQHRIMRLGLNPQIPHIFISHLHGDHVLGLPGMLLNLYHMLPPGGGKRPMAKVYGPPGLRKWVRHTLGLCAATSEFVDIVEMHSPPSEPSSIVRETNTKDSRNLFCDSDRVWTLVDEQDHQILAKEIVHCVPTWGFVYIEKTPPRRLDKERLRHFEIPTGPLCKQLKDGESVVTSKGVLVHPNQVLGPVLEGRKVTILGDTSNASGIASIAMDSTLAVHECTYTEALLDKALQVKHSTPSIAAAFGNLIAAKNLVLTHFSARLYEENIEELQRHVREQFVNPVYCAYDGMHLVIKRRKTEANNDFY